MFHCQNPMYSYRSRQKSPEYLPGKKLHSLYLQVWHKASPRCLLPSAKSRDLLDNGGAGGEASLPGDPVWGTGNGVSPNFLFPKRLGDYALDKRSKIILNVNNCRVMFFAGRHTELCQIPKSTSLLEPSAIQGNISHADCWQ